MKRSRIEYLCTSWDDTHLVVPIEIIHQRVAARANLAVASAHEATLTAEQRFRPAKRLPETIKQTRQAKLSALATELNNRRLHKLNEQSEILKSLINAGCQLPTQEIKSQIERLDSAFDSLEKAGMISNASLPATNSSQLT
jgi:hypothetical protein